MPVSASVLRSEFTGVRLATGVLGRGVPARPALYVEPRGGSPPTPCAAHPEPFSYVEVDSRNVVWWPVPVWPCLRMEGRGGTRHGVEST